jgi:hypothetical protein
MRLPPFAALIPDRPWPPTGLTTARWIAEVPVLDVRLDELHLTQQHVNVAALFGHTDPAGSADRTRTSSSGPAACGSKTATTGWCAPRWSSVPR